MAESLRVSTTLVSQVVNGDKHFSMELASDLCDYMGLGEKEADHFLLLLEYARAGSHGYQKRLKRRVDLARAAALKLSERVEQDRKLTDTESAIFFSSWAYAGIFHLVATNPKLTIDQLAERLKMPRHSVAKCMDFLIESGILVSKGGSLEVGMKSAHIGADSPFVVQHHQNWRVQAFNKMTFAGSEELFYTAPMSLSHETAAVIRSELISQIDRIVKLVGPSPSETVRCLNIDWFGY